jgi:hypothetical protein
MRLLVCGPRNLDASALPAMCDALLRVLTLRPLSADSVMAHGAARGGDFLWEEALGLACETRPELWVPIRRMPAKWRLPDGTTDRGAGPKRNQRMLEQVRRTYWLAAHWSEEPDTPGTADMVRRLRGAEVPGEVVIVPRPAPVEPSARQRALWRQP